MPFTPRSVSPFAPIGVAAAVQPSSQSRPKIFDEFALTGKVAIVTGGNSGIGLEMALALCEAGARSVYCLDIASTPSKEWESASTFVQGMKNASNLEYICIDVTQQEEVWSVVGRIGDKEGRIDVCIASAGIVHAAVSSLEITGDQFKKVLDVDVNGVFFTAQAAGQQMIKYKCSGSIILVASVAGSVSLGALDPIAYSTSKSAVLQMARSLACELGSRGIRVNSLSPGYLLTPMTAPHLENREIVKACSNNPMGRIGRPDEVRGVAVWLASGASSFCTGSDIRVDGGHTAW